MHREAEATVTPATASRPNGDLVLGRGALDERELRSVVAQLSRELGEVPAQPASCERRYWPLLQTDQVDAWLIEWGPSTFLGLHDHGGSSGAFQVLSGELIEVATDLVHREALTTDHLGAGAERSFSPDHVHEMWNPTETPAWSIHAYSPPLSSMNFYSSDPVTFLESHATETRLEWEKRSEMTAPLEELL